MRECADLPPGERAGVAALRVIVRHLVAFLTGAPAGRGATRPRGRSAAWPGARDQAGCSRPRRERPTTAAPVKSRAIPPASATPPMASPGTEIPPPLGSAGLRVASAPVSVMRPETAPVAPLVDGAVMNPVTAPGWPPEVVSVTKFVPVSAGAATPALDASVTKPVTAPGTPPAELSVTMPETAAGAGVVPPSTAVIAFAPLAM